MQRTYRNNAQFYSEENAGRLKRILLGYAELDPEVGYVQGMNVIVAQLMMLTDIEAN